MQDEQDAPTLTEEEARAAAKAVTTLLQRWGLSDAEARDLLGGVPEETWAAWKGGAFGPVSPNLGARLSHLLGVHKALRLIFSGDQARVYGWVRRDNAAFGGLPALVVMREEGASGLLHVRLHLENQLSSPDEGRLTTRDRAFREGVRRLERRVSVADLLTDVQRERIARDDPFEVADPAHPAMKRNERSLTTPAFPGTGPCPG
jgi:hypothetical protein